MELFQANDFSARLTWVDLSSKSEPLETPPALLAARQQLLSVEDVLRCQRELGKLRRLAAASRPDISAPLARLALKVNLPRRSGIYCINDLMKTAQVWRLPAVLKCASSSYLKEPARGDANSAVGARAGQVHCGTTSLVVWSDAACRNQSIEGRCRMGYVTGLMSSYLSDPLRILQWTSKFTRW